MPKDLKTEAGERNLPTKNKAQPKRTYRRFKASSDLDGRSESSQDRKAIVTKVANEMHAVTEDGKTQQRSLLEIVVLRLRQLALEKSSPRAFDQFMQLHKKYLPQPDGADCAYLVVPHVQTEEEFIREAEIFNAEENARRAARSRE